MQIIRGYVSLLGPNFLVIFIIPLIGFSQEKIKMKIDKDLWLIPGKNNGSEFHFVFDKCKCCYYLKAKHKIDRPKDFPGIFSKFDLGREISLIKPEWKIERCEKFIQMY